MRPFTLSRIDLRQIRIFLAIVENEGVSAAAYVTGIDLTGVSRALGELETRIGASLCHRGRAGFRLTAQGEAVYAAARRYLDETLDFEAALGAVSRAVDGQIRVGVVDNTLCQPSCPLSDALRLLHRRFPNLFVELSVLTPSTIEVAVRDRKIDVGLTAQPTALQPLGYVKAFEEEHRLYAGAGSGIAARFAAASPSDCPPLGCDYVARSYRSSPFESLEQRLEVKTVASANSVEGTAILIAAGLGCGLLPTAYATSFLGQTITELACPGLPLLFPFYLVYRTDAEAHPVISMLREAMAVDAASGGVAAIRIGTGPSDDRAASGGAA